MFDKFQTAHDFSAFRFTRLNSFVAVLYQILIASTCSDNRSVISLNIRENLILNFIFFNSVSVLT